MPIKINGATSGSTTITAPATGSDETIELSTALASKLPYSYGTATPSTTDSGFLWYDSNSTPAAPKFWDGSAFQALTSGKILQVVRATDSTARSTTSTSYVDVTGMSVTITPQKSDSAIILIHTGMLRATKSGTNTSAEVTITDSSNNQISGAQDTQLRIDQAGSAGILLDTSFISIGYATPATTSATTYKVRFRAGNSTSGGTTATLFNNLSTGQLFAIEVAA